MKTEKCGLKLYVVGESSGDPSKWRQWATKSLVIAENPQEAIRLVDGDPRSAVAELKPVSPCVLMAD